MEENFRVIIAGSRDYTNYEEANVHLDKLFSQKKPTHIICGMARGSDMLGFRYANENNISLLQYYADWDKYGKSAGFKRNELMAQNADALVAFWDGKSHGTKNMIELAKRYNLETRIIYFI